MIQSRSGEQGKHWSGAVSASGCISDSQPMSFETLYKSLNLSLSLILSFLICQIQIMIVRWVAVLSASGGVHVDHSALSLLCTKTLIKDGYYRRKKLSSAMGYLGAKIMPSNSAN